MNLNFARMGKRTGQTFSAHGHQLPLSLFRFSNEQFVEQQIERFRKEGRKDTLAAPRPLAMKLSTRFVRVNDLDYLFLKTSVLAAAESGGSPSRIESRDPQQKNNPGRRSRGCWSPLWLGKCENASC